MYQPDTKYVIRSHDSVFIKLINLRKTYGCKKFENKRILNVPVPYHTLEINSVISPKET